MTRTRNLPLTLVAAVAIATGAVACGSDGDTSNVTADTTDDAMAATSDLADTDAATPEPAAAGDGGTALTGDDAGGIDDGTAEATEPADDAATSEAVTALVASDYVGDYTLVDDEFGTITTATVADGIRSIVSNALPNHDTGQFPNAGNPNAISEQDAGYEYPLDATWSGTATFVRTPGVAVNGVKFEPNTAETVACDSGEVYRVEALQDTYDLGLDFNNAHVQPTGEYHYHGLSELLVDAFDTDDDLVHVGFAADGYLIYASKSGAFASSYELSADARTGTGCIASGAAGGGTVEIDGTAPDGTYDSDWVYVDGLGDLDECNGTSIDGQYAYVVTDEYPFVSRCLMGEVTEEGPGGGRGGQPPVGAPAPADG